MKQSVMSNLLRFLLAAAILFSLAVPLAAQIDLPEDMLRGVATRDSLVTNWPDFQPDFYDLSPDAVVGLQAWQTPVDITVFLGTWCSDSKREVPRFFAIADEVNNSNFHYTLIGVDRSKQDGAGKAKAAGIERVPTFIFYQKGKEIGRIVETPERTVEDDWLAILTHYAKTGRPLAVDRVLKELFLQMALGAAYW